MHENHGQGNLNGGVTGMSDVFDRLPKAPKLLSRMAWIEYATVGGVTVYSLISRNAAIFAIEVIGIAIVYALQRLGAA